MSRLDDILSQTANDISLGVITGEWKETDTKQQIKDLVLELIGEDEAIKHPAVMDAAQHRVRSQNNLRAELRHKVEEL